MDVEGALSLLIVDDDRLSSGLEVDVDGGSAPLGLKKLLIFMSHLQKNKKNKKINKKKNK